MRISTLVLVASIRKSVMSINFCPYFWGRKWLRRFYGRLAFFGSFCWKKAPMPIKFLGARIFPKVTMLLSGVRSECASPRPCHTLRRADTQTPTRHSVFSTHSDTQAVPAFHCIWLCLKAFFRHASVFKMHRHAVYHCLKEVQKPRFDMLVFLKRAFRHARVRF